MFTTMTKKQFDAFVARTNAAVAETNTRGYKVAACIRAFDAAVAKIDDADDAKARKAAFADAVNLDKSTLSMYRGAAAFVDADGKHALVIDGASISNLYELRRVGDAAAAVEFCAKHGITARTSRKDIRDAVAAAFPTKKAAAKADEKAASNAAVAAVDADAKAAAENFRKYVKHFAGRLSAVDAATFAALIKAAAVVAPSLAVDNVDAATFRRKTDVKAAEKADAAAAD